MKSMAKKWWILVMVLLAVLTMTTGAASADGDLFLPSGMDLEIPVVLKDFTPRRGDVLIGPSQGQTGDTLSYSIAPEEGVAQYQFKVAVLVDEIADTQYRAKRSGSNEFSYTFYEPGTYFVNVYRYDSDGNPVMYNYYGTEYPFIQKAVTITDSGSPNALTAAVEEAASECWRGNDFDTAVAINDYLVNLVTYEPNWNAPAEEVYYSPEGALLNRNTCVCNGYCRAYELIAQACGLSCGRVTGLGNGGNHAWNVVSVFGNWYQLDTTWNDTSGNMHLYLLMNDTLMGREHTPQKYPSGTVSCTTLEHNYFVFTERWKILAQGVMDSIQAQVDNVSLMTVEADLGNRAYLENGNTTSSPDVLYYNGNFIAGALSCRRLRSTDELREVRASFTYNDSTHMLTGTLTDLNTNHLRVSPVGDPERWVTSGDSVQLQVDASCDDGNLSYWWYKEGNTVQGARTDTITTDPITQDTVYECEVEDSVGIIRWVKFLLKVRPVVSELQELTLDVPATASIDNETVYTNRTVYFRFTPAETAIYTFGPVSDSDFRGALYDSEMNLLAEAEGSGFDHVLEAGNPYVFGVGFIRSGRTGDLAVLLTKKQAARHEAAITWGQGYNNELLTVDPGDAAVMTFLAGAGEGETVTYQWYEGTTAIQGAANNVCTLTDIQKTTYYRCVAECSASGTREGIFYVTVENQLTAEPVGGQFRFLSAGETAELAVEADCLYGELEYAWFRDSTYVQGSVGKTGITTAAFSGETVYFCQVLDQYENARHIRFFLITRPTAESATALALDTEQTATITSIGTFFRFTPEVTAPYTFESTSTSLDDTYGYLLDEDMQQMAENDDNGSDFNFRITATLQAGKTYYFFVTYNNTDNTGSFPVLLTMSGDPIIEPEPVPAFDSFVIPAGTTVIEDDAFFGTAEETARVPYGCTTIGDRAFLGSSLQAVYLPETVTGIGTDAFPEGTVIYTPADSPAAVWGTAHGYTVKELDLD